jgi:hypothetical protein
LMCGRAGHMAVHTPDICYRGAGYEMVGEPVKRQITLPSGAAQFWNARFRPADGGVDQDLSLWWAWNADGLWLAPSSPRLAFAGRPFLYKLYLVYGAPNTPAQDSVGPAFLQELVPALQGALFPAAGSLG